MSTPVISALVDVASADSPMMRFYRNKTVFVTGGTGFLGMLFVEKLLRSAAKSVYVLVRPKKNKSPTERIQETFAGVVFEKLAQLDPDYMTRIKLIEGDTCKADLGISADDRKEIIANVQIVIHSAADVRFDKPLQELCLTNVRGTKALTLLAEQMEKLIVFAYISTAFSQFYRDKIEEKFYPPPYDPDDMIRIAEYFEEHQTDELNFLTDKILLPWENTYVFTKALSEEVVRRVAHKFPTVVIRPSVIIATYEDPLPAWTNNIYGLNGYCIGIGMGFIKVSAGSSSKTVEMICADFVTNGTLAAMWNKVNASHCGTCKLQETMFSCYHHHPLMKALSVPSNTFAPPGLAFFVMTIMHHVIPAAVLDAFFRMTNSKMRLLPLYRKYQDFLKRTSYFLNHIWHFEHQNMKRIIENMSAYDQRYFNCDIFKFKTLEYVRPYQLGLRTYVAKEPQDERHINAAKQRYRILRLISYVTSTFYYGFLGYLLYVFVNVAGLNLLY